MAEKAIQKPTENPDSKGASGVQSKVDASEYQGGKDTIVVAGTGSVAILDGKNPVELSNGDGKPGSISDSKAEPSLAASKEHLEKAIDSQVVEQRREQFKESVDKFLARTDVSDKEKSGTLEQISRLLESDSGVAELPLRRRAAQEMIYHAANPDTTWQGMHPTCGPNAVAHSLYEHAPSIVAKMTTDSLLSGKFTGKDGKSIEIPQENFTRSLADGGFPPQPTSRTYALQIAEAAILNEIGQHVVPPMRYVESGVKSAFADMPIEDSPPEFLIPQRKWILADGSERSMEAGTGNFSQSGGIPPWQVAESLTRLTGKQSKVLRSEAFALNDPAPAESEAAKLGQNAFAYFKSETQFQSLLAGMKASGELPTVASVSKKWIERINSQGKRTAATAADEEDHFIGIDDYKPASGSEPAMVRVHDSARSEAAKLWVPLSKIYDAIK